MTELLTALRAGLFAILLVAPADAAHAASLTLDATAGLGGVSKAGRWTPLFVEIASAEHIAGELVVSWGSSRLRRAVVISPGHREDIELYIRTVDVQGAMNVRLVSGGTTLQSIDVPVRILRPDEQFKLCVSSTLSLAANDSACSSAVSSDQLPRSPRGYDAVDTVAWAGSRTLSRDRRTAFERWTVLHQLEVSGDLALTSQVARPLVHRLLPAATARLVAGLTVAYVVGLVVTGFVISAAGVSWRFVALAFGVITALASGAAAGIGRAGPGRELQVQHNALLQQIPDTSGSLLTVRGIAEFPAFDAYAARLAAEDAVLTIATDAARTEQAIDQDGFPIVDGVFGLGARQAFTIEAVTEAQPLAIRWTGRTATIVNQSNFALSGCRFGEGFSLTDAGDLRPGESVTAGQVTDVAGPVFTCMFRGPVMEFTAINRPVVTTGITTVTLYRPTVNPDTVDRRDD